MTPAEEKAFFEKIERLRDAASKASTLAAMNPALGITGYTLMTATNDLIAWSNAKAAENTALQERVKELEGALEPFAKQAQKWKDAQMHFGAEPPPEGTYIQAPFRRMDFEAARTALRGGE